MTSPLLPSSLSRLPALLALLLAASPALAASPHEPSLAELFGLVGGSGTSAASSVPPATPAASGAARKPKASGTVGGKPGTMKVATPALKPATKPTPVKAAAVGTAKTSRPSGAVALAKGTGVKTVAKTGSVATAGQAAGGDTGPGREAWLGLTPDASRLAQWVRITSDNQRQPFAIIDKRNARLFVFDAQGQLRGNAPVLLGLAPGDHSVPGIGEKPIGQIRPEERTTPAGRFQGEHGLNANGEDIIWIDYDAAVSMHRVRPTNPKERRLQRLASTTVADNRISYGCVNVPKHFYDKVLLKTFVSSDRPVVYVLPDTRSLSEVFAGFPPAGQGAQAAESDGVASSGTATASWISPN